MPRIPKHPCAYPGCPELVERGQRYCEQHQKLENHNYEKYHRNRETKKRYRRGWQLIRSAYAAKHPLCEECLKRGVYTPTEHVHHIVPLSEGGTNEEENLMALCRPCHSRIHAERGDRWGRRGDDR